jgi:hypothetical protein
MPSTKERAMTYTPSRPPQPPPDPSKTSKSTIAIVTTVILVALAAIFISASLRPQTQALPTPSTTTATYAPARPYLLASVVVTPEPTPTPEPPTGPVTTFGGGSYLVGPEVVPGVYRSEGVEINALGADASACSFFAKKSDGSYDTRTYGVTPKGPSRTTLYAGQTFTSSGCMEWKKVG